MKLAIEAPFNQFTEAGVIVHGNFVKMRHSNFITDSHLFQCLDCGRWSDSLNVLNAVDCEELDEDRTLEELRVG